MKAIPGTGFPVFRSNTLAVSLRKPSFSGAIAVGEQNQSTSVIVIDCKSMALWSILENQFLNLGALRITGICESITCVKPEIGIPL